MKKLDVTAYHNTSSQIIALGDAIRDIQSWINEQEARETIKPDFYKLSDGKWHHIPCVDEKIFLDGRLLETDEPKEKCECYIDNDDYTHREDCPIHSKPVLPKTSDGGKGNFYATVDKEHYVEGIPTPGKGSVTINPSVLPKTECKNCGGKHEGLCNHPSIQEQLAEIIGEVDCSFEFNGKTYNMIGKTAIKALVQSLLEKFDIKAK